MLLLQIRRFFLFVQMFHSLQNSKFLFLVKRCEFMQRFELFIRSIPVGHTLSKWKCETEHYIHLWLFRFAFSRSTVTVASSSPSYSSFSLYFTAFLYPDLFGEESYSTPLFSCCCIFLGGLLIRRYFWHHI